MTCAEARRQLPGPDGVTPEAVQVHLAACDPCRAEAEALREVDRRLQRLGAYRLLATAEQAVQLDRQLGPLTGQPAPRRPPAAVALGVALALLVALTLALLLRL